MGANDIVVRIVNLPASVAGYTMTSPDGTYNVYLNARHTSEKRRETYMHEMRHIEDGDCESDECVVLLEAK